MTTRRTFLTTSSLAPTAWLGAPRLARTALRPTGHACRTPGPGAPDFKALAHRALDAATAAGATYADVHFTLTTSQSVSPSKPPRARTELLAVGVRALAKGTWGFAADTHVDPDGIVTLARTATEFARGSAWPSVPPVDLGLRPPAAVGSWEMPVARDPFTVPDEEYQALIQTIAGRGVAAGINQFDVLFNFTRQARTFASTEGAFATQTVYDTLGTARGWASQLVLDGVRVPFVSPGGVGYEVFDAPQFLDRIPEWGEIAKAMRDAKPFAAPGRYEVVFDAHTVAAFISALGAALEADRALGDEANAGGTSFLSPVERVLGSAGFPAAVTVTADRTMAGGAATVRWDAEGVAAEPFPLVTDGVVVDYLTSRASAPELAAWYKKRGAPVRSHGCLGAENALAVPLVQTPNLVLQPGAQDLSFEALLAGIDNGYAVLGGEVTMDQQRLTGMGLLGTPFSGGVIYEVRRGKLGAPVSNAAFLIRVPDLWKDLVVLGGARSVATRGFTVVKGQPEQRLVHSVRAVAARFRNVTLRSAMP